MRNIRTRIKRLCTLRPTRSLLQVTETAVRCQLQLLSDVSIRILLESLPKGQIVCLMLMGRRCCGWAEHLFDKELAARDHTNRICLDDWMPTMTTVLFLTFFLFFFLLLSLSHSELYEHLVTYITRKGR